MPTTAAGADTTGSWADASQVPCSAVRFVDVLSRRGRASEFDPLVQISSAALVSVGFAGGDFGGVESGDDERSSGAAPSFAEIVRSPVDFPALQHDFTGAGSTGVAAAAEPDEFFFVDESVEGDLLAGALQQHSPASRALSEHWQATPSVRSQQDSPACPPIGRPSEETRNQAARRPRPIRLKRSPARQVRATVRLARTTARRRRSPKRPVRPVRRCVLLSSDFIGMTRLLDKTVTIGPRIATARRRHNEAPSRSNARTVARQSF